MIAKAIARPRSSLADIAREWTPEYETVLPDGHAYAYQALFQRYLEPFECGDDNTPSACEKSHP